MNPQQWHIYIVDLEPRVGTKPGKQRPCLCIQPSEFCEWGLGSAVILPITSKTTLKSAKPLRVALPSGTCGLDKPSDILIDQILAWDVSLFRSDLGEVPEGIKREVRESLVDFLDLNQKN